MKKPEILGGQVKEFINEHSAETYYMRDFELYRILERDIRSFYSQKLDMETISKYFECRTDGINKYPAVEIQIFEFENDMFIRAENRKQNETEWKLEFSFGTVVYRPEDDTYDYTRHIRFAPQPKTLEQLISCLLRAGFNLIWKE